MPVEKLSISFERSLAASVKRAAQSDGESVSSWLADAATTKARQKNLREALDAFAADHGALAEAEVDSLIQDARRESRVSNGGASRLRAPKLAARKRKARAA
jgi:ApbE superfamily uncharacterized protein (UPF0280 family)